MTATTGLVRRTRVSEVMTARPIVLGEDDSVQFAGIVLLREGISGVPVADHHGDLVGVFSHSDVLARFAAPRQRRGPLARLDDRHAHAVTVGEACSRPAVTISPDATVDTAAREMLDRDIGRLVVVDDEIVGIVSRSDVLKLFMPTWRDRTIAQRRCDPVRVRRRRRSHRTERPRSRPPRGPVLVSWPCDAVIFRRLPTSGGDRPIDAERSHRCTASSDEERSSRSSPPWRPCCSRRRS